MVRWRSYHRSLVDDVGRKWEKLELTGLRKFGGKAVSGLGVGFGIAVFWLGMDSG
jgi:hypothetical protein